MFVIHGNAQLELNYACMGYGMFMIAGFCSYKQHGKEFAVHFCPLQVESEVTSFFMNNITAFINPKHV